MGCDIHVVLERRYRDKWVGIDAFKGHECDWEKGFCIPEARSRYYARFAALAGVRGIGPEPRGLPSDISDLTKIEFEDWAGDGHSHSWLPLKEAADVYLATSPNSDDYVRKYPCSHFFSVDETSPEVLLNDYRLVFWFDN